MIDQYANWQPGLFLFQITNQINQFWLIGRLVLVIRDEMRPALLIRLNSFKIRYESDSILYIETYLVLFMVK